MEGNRPWSYVFLTIAIGLLHLQGIQAADYYDEIGQARGDNDGSYSEPIGNAGLGFSGVVQRHDGYVKGETPTIPQTSFSCSSQPYNPGLYADMETNCQVYHVCFEDRQESFLCGPGTNFNQRILACDFWYNFDCQDSATFYGANSEIGKVPSTPYRPDQSVEIRRPSTYPQQRPGGDSGSYQPPLGPSPQPIPPRIPSPPSQIPSRTPFRPPQARPPAPISQRPQPPRIPQPSAQPPSLRPPSISQEIDNGYDYPPVQQPLDLPPPRRPSPPITSRPVFPTVVSPPRISRPPFRPPPEVSRRPDESRHQYQPPSSGSGSLPVHPDSEVKGSDYVPPRPRPQPPRTPQPARPVDVEYPSYPSRPRPVSQRPVQPPVDRREQTPSIVQQEHVDYVPPPPPRRPSPPRQPAPRPPTQQRQHPPPRQPSPQPRQPPPPRQPSHQPRQPPPPPRQPSPPRHPSPPRQPSPSRQPPHVIQQEVVELKPGYGRPPSPSRPQIDYVPPPQPPRQPSLPPPPPPRRPSPPPPPPQPQQPISRPRQPQPPQRPRPVFPPVNDHPNANVKGGPGYRPPPPSQFPSYEPTRRPSGSSQPGISRPPPPPPPPRPRPPTPRPQTPRPQTPRPQTLRPQTPRPQTLRPQTPRPQTLRPQTPRPHYEPPISAVKPSGIKQPGQSVDTGIYQPRPSTAFPPLPPPRPFDHPDSAIKGADYRDPTIHRPPQRVISPATAVTTVKRPQSGSGVYQPPPAPSSRVKTKTPPTVNQIYERPIPHPPTPPRVKLPSQTTEQKVLSQTSGGPHQGVHTAPRPRPIDHPNANIKGGPGYRPSPTQSVQAIQPVIIVPPSAPSIAIHRKTPPSQPGTGRASGGGHQPQTPPQRPYHPRGDGGYQQEIIHQEVYEPQKQVPVVVKKEPAPQQVIRVKQPQPDYNIGSSYKRGQETYPKPEFQQQIHAVSTPSRSHPTTKQGSASQNRITQQNLSGGHPAPPPFVGSGSGRRPSSGGGQVDYPFAQVPGHQPPDQRQVFPYRENPDHPNESIKGTSAYRPPPPANFQSAASEVQEQVAESIGEEAAESTNEQVAKIVEEPASKLGDTGTE